MIKVFETVREYNSFVQGGLVAGDVYYVKEDESAHFQTNNIDGSLGVYDFIPGSGDSDYYLPVLVDASFTANGSYSPADYDADGFDQITIAVPSSGIVPTGTLTISSNGTYDVTNYASAAVSVPASAVVSGTLDISANGSNIDVTDYASVNVNVAAPAPSLNWQTLTTESGNYGVFISSPTVGDTYVFKTSASNVYFGILGVDTDTDGDIDEDDEPWGGYGIMVPNKEYYLTISAYEKDGAVNTPLLGFYGEGVGGAGGPLPVGTVIQYAVLS